MKKIIKKLMAFTAITIWLISCNKGVVPGLIPGRVSKTFDESAFNYVYVEAIKQKIMGNSGEALKYLEQCLKINPTSDAAYYQMAQIVLSNRDLKMGKRFASKAYELEPQNIWYILTLAGIYYEERKLDSAIIYYEKAVKIYPEKENLKLNLGNLYSENGEYDKARIIFGSIDDKYGVNESSTLGLIKSLMAERKYDEALKKTYELLDANPEEILYNGLLAEIYKNMGESKKALEVYTKLMGRNPDNPQTQLALCEFLISQKEYNDLLLLLNSVSVNDKILKEEKVELFAELIENPDIIKSYEGEMELALMVLEGNYRNDDVIVLLRPELMQRAKKLSKASERLEEIIKERPDNYFAWEKLLLLYYELKDFRKLMEKGEECSTRFNRSYLAKILYAQGAIENARYEIALEELRKAGILAGDNKELKLQVLAMKSDTYYRKRDLPKAFEIFEEALKIDEDDLTVLNNYAYYLAEQNMRLKDAEYMAKKVISKEENNNTFLDTYAWVLYKRGKTGRAERIMKKIMQSENNLDAEYYEHYGYILRKRKNCVEASKYWEIAIEIDNTKSELIKEIENCKGRR